MVRVAGMVEVFSGDPLGALQEPASAYQIAEHDQVAPVDEDELEIAPPQRAAGPPAVLHDPLLPQGVHGHGLDRRRRAAGVGLDRGGLGVAEAARDRVWALRCTYTVHKTAHTRADPRLLPFAAA